MFCSIIQNHLNAINNGAIPNIENSWNYLCKDECIKAVDYAFDTYERWLRENLVQKLPTTEEEIKLANKLAKEAALEVFKKKAFGEI